MYNSFSKYEQDFQQWRDADYPEVNPLTRDFLLFLKQRESGRKLWRHQEEAILRVVYSYELLQMKNLLLNIVTGGGKTAIIAAVMAWLKICHDIHKFLVLCPNTIVRDRLEDDFFNAKVFRDFGFFPPGYEHYTNELGLHILEPGANPQGILENGIILGNIHQLYQSNINGRRNFAYIMNYVEEIAIFNDEAHNTPAEEYDRTLFALSPKCRFRLDTTATPDRADGKTPDSKMIYEYTITDAQAEVPPIIKNIVVYQPELSLVQLTYTNPETGERKTVDEMDEEFEKIEKGISATQWVTDPDPMRKQIQIALDRLEEQRRRALALAGGRYRPILFVVAICIKDAEAARDILEKEFKVRTLLVTEKSDEEEREEARRLGKKNSPYDAVVSVLMLREGWDVPEVGVILLLRKFSSRVYGQQVIGRGLRLNVRGEDLQEICAIIDHKKLNHQWLWDIVGAKVRDNVGQGELFGDEDLPPKRKPQILVNPDLLIDIPEPTGEPDVNFLDDLEDITVEQGDYPNWQSILDAFEYGAEVEISRVEIDKVIASKLRDNGFVELIEPPAINITKEKPQDENIQDVIEKLKNTIRDIASALLAEEGIGSHELGYFYNVLMDHIRKKLLNGRSVGTASMELLTHALNHRYTILHNFIRKPGLVTSIVKYKEKKEDKSSANK